jgi:hypothetical protein
MNFARPKRTKIVFLQEMKTCILLDLVRDFFKPCIQNQKNRKKSADGLARESLSRRLHGAILWYLASDFCRPTTY